MKRVSLLLLLLIFSMLTFAQGKSLYASRIVKVKAGMNKAFEAALKAHILKYHTQDKMYVFQLITGANAGSYQLVQGPYTWDEFDKLKLGDEHDNDFATNVLPKIDSDNGETVSRKWDELSYGTADITTEVSRVTTLHIKRGKFDDAKALFAKVGDIYKKTNDTRNMSVYSKMLAGTDAQLILVYRYPNGMKEFEEGVHPGLKDLMTKNASEDAWTVWQKAYDDCVESADVVVRKFKKDISSK